MNLFTFPSISKVYLFESPVIFEMPMFFLNLSTEKSFENWTSILLRLFFFKLVYTGWAVATSPLGELMSTSLKAIYPLSCKLATFSIGFCKEIQWHSIGVIMVPSASIARTGLSLSLTLVKPYRRSIHACSMHNFSLGRVFGGRIRDAYSRTEKNFVVNEPGTVITRFFIYLPWEIPRMTIRCRRCSLRTWICDGALLNAASDDLLQTLISRLGFHSASKSGQYPFREHCWEAGRNRTFIVKVPMI